MTKGTRGGKHLFGLQIPIQRNQKVKAGGQSGQLEVGTEAESMGEGCLLTCSPELVHPAVLYKPESSEKRLHCP